MSHLRYIPPHLLESECAVLFPRDSVGYRVFLGNGQYFVSSDVGGGKTQWYGFHREAAGGTDEEGRRKERLLSIFGSWTDMGETLLLILHYGLPTPSTLIYTPGQQLMAHPCLGLQFRPAVTDLIKATPEGDVLRRDIYDRAPVLKWTQGRVALLGDSVHAMQPNLGQGGCMAIEDAYQLVADLSNEVEAARDSGREINVEGVLVGYTLVRILLTQMKMDACYPFSFLFGVLQTLLQSSSCP